MKFIASAFRQNRKKKTEAYLLVVFELNIKPTGSYHSAVFYSARIQCTESGSAVLHVHVIRLLPLPSLTPTSSLRDCCCFFHSLIFMPGSVYGIGVLVLEGHLNWASVLLSIGSRCQRRKLFPLLKPQPLLSDCFPTFKCILQAPLLSPRAVPHSDSPKGSALCNLKLFQSLPV